MPYFKWFGYTQGDQSPQSGSYASSSFEELTARLAEEQINLVRAVPVTSRYLLSIPLREKVNLFDHMSVLLQAHIPLAQALTIVSAMTKHRFAADIMRESARQVSKGVSLHEVAAAFPELWDPISYKMLCVGHDGGILAQLFKDRVVQLQGINHTATRLRAVLLMPLITVIFLCAVILFLLVWVVPQFKRVFSMLKTPIPYISQVMLTLSDQLTLSHITWGIAGLACGYGLLVAFGKTQHGKLAKAWCLLHLPIVGTVYKNLVRAQFLEFTAILLKAGMHASQALSFVSDLFSNPIFKQDVQLLAYKTEIGKTLQQACAESSFMNEPDIIAAVTIGHETGQIAALTREMGHRYRALATSQLDRLVTLSQPIIIVFLGVLIGAIMLALYLPLLNISLTPQ